MNSRKLWISAIFLFVVGDALVLQTRGPLLVSFRESFGVSEGLLGLVAPAGTAGFVLAVLAVGFVAGRIDFNRGLVLGAGATAICLSLMGGAPVYWLFLLFMLGQGTATGVVRALDRPILSHLYPSSRGRVFTLHALAWALGAVSGPIVVNTVLTVADWRVTYALLSLFFVPIVVVLWRLEVPDDVIDERQLSVDALSRLLRRPSIVGMTAALTVVGLVEGIIFTWLPFYATEYLGRDLANVLLSAYLLAYIPGRVFYTWLADRIRYIDVTILSSVGAFPMFYLLFDGTSPTVLFGTIFVAGFFFSGLFPLISAFGVDAAPEYSGPVSAIATAGTYGGMAVGPVVVGLLAERVGIAAAMTVPVALLGGLIVVLGITRASIDRTPA